MSFDSDDAVATELDLYAENESALYGQFQSIIRNLAAKIKRGKYDAAKAPKLWAYWYEAAAKRYAKESGSSDWSRMFPKKIRDALAKDRARDEYEKIRNGEYDWIRR